MKHRETKIVVAIDSFKGCLTSTEANQAAASGIHDVMPHADVVQQAVSDGGEGWTEAFRSAIGGEYVETEAADPLMRRIKVRYLITDSGIAVIETAKAIGLTLLTEKERNPVVASSYGVGQLVADALCRGCRDIIVGLGGSGTSDCGEGMLRALTDIFSADGTWQTVRMPEDVHFTIATDVENPLCGEKGAAHVFAPQKGATPDMVERLEKRARLFADQSALMLGHDYRNRNGAGAAGGLGYAFMQYMDAKCQSGAELLLDAMHFDKVIGNASMIITGEGSADRQTLMGKLPSVILQRAMRKNVPTCLIAGRIRDREELIRAGFAEAKCINPDDITNEEAMMPEVAKKNIRKTLQHMFLDKK